MSDILWHVKASLVSEAGGEESSPASREARGCGSPAAVAWAERWEGVRAGWQGSWEPGGLRARGEGQGSPAPSTTVVFAT